MTPLTPALLDALEDIDGSPGVVLTGPAFALGNKLRRRGLVETFVGTIDEKHADVIRGFRTTDAGRAVLGRGLTPATKAKIESEIVMILHAHRDCMRNRGNNTNTLRFDINDGYYGEAIGIMRALRLLGLGEFGAVNKPGTLSAWLNELERRVLAEENYGDSNECDYCLERFGKDGAGRKR